MILLRPIAILCLSSLPAFAQVLPEPLTDADFLWDGAPDKDLVSLGRDLFFDPILSGNQNISCGTCHDPARGTGDGVALSIGEGGVGFGPERRVGKSVTGHVPRNAQPLYNIGARAYGKFFHDGRLEFDKWSGSPSRLRTPAGEDLPEGIENALAAQAMFPVLSSIEMAGQPGENSVANAVSANNKPLAWAILAQRLSETPGYARRFVQVFGDITSPADIRFTHAGEALAAFQSLAFRSDNSPFDLRLAGIPLPTKAEQGLQLFYGKASCNTCHSGALLTDHDFHAIGVPQIGPGKDHGFDNSYRLHTGFQHRVEDLGRFAVTGDPDDKYSFRTPSLRNVALTGPWGHDGAFADLEDMVRHHLNAPKSLAGYVVPDLLPLATVVETTNSRSGPVEKTLEGTERARFDMRYNWAHASEPLRASIANSIELDPVSLTKAEIDQLMAFLDALTDPSSVDQSGLIPRTVPSGLPPQPTWIRLP